MSNIVYKQQPDGSYKKIVLTEKTIDGFLQFVDEKELLRGDTMTGLNNNLGGNRGSF